MACATCNDPDSTDVRGTCAVCIENNNDSREKRVKYCKVCKQYICAAHRTDVLARGVAAFKHLFKNLK